MDDLVQIVFIAFILLLGLLSGRKKKKQVPQRPRPGRSGARRPQRAPQRREPALSTRAGPPAPPERERSTLERTLFDLLQQHIPEPPPTPEPVPLPEEVDDEARSLEQLEISGEERHAEFHERYFEEPAMPAAAVPGRRRPVALDPKTLREAVIWHTVLGRPKGLD